MTTHTELLNSIAKRIGAETYLEIGVFNVDHNFNHIDVASKIGVDPAVQNEKVFRMTSDDFFKLHKVLSATASFDLIFVDGLHHSDQVKKDIINAWQCLSLNGIMVIHDTNPHSEKITHVPRDNGEWCGDVYKTISQLKSHKWTVDFDYGCTILQKTSKDPLLWFDTAVNWQQFDPHRKQLLNLITVAEAEMIIQGFKTINYANAGQNYFDRTVLG